MKDTIGSDFHDKFDLFYARACSKKFNKGHGSSHRYDKKKISLRKRIVEPGGKLECFMVLTKVGKVCPEPDNRNVVVIA